MSCSYFSLYVKFLFERGSFFMNQENVGKFIAALRKEKNLTQEQLAEILGVNNRSISRWENGHCMPDLSLLQVICKELGVSISELLNGRRMSKEEMIDLRDSINSIIEMSNKEKNMKTKKLNNYFLAGLLCILVVILNNRFGVLSFIFREPIDDFVAGFLTSMGLLFEVIGFYNNNHDKTFKQRKKEFFNA